MADVIAKFMAPQVLGEDPSAIGPIMRKLNSSIEENTGAKASIDLALHDLVAKSLGVPIYKLLGGTNRGSPFYLNMDMAMGSPEETLAEAQFYFEKGYRLLKLRVGSDTELDLKRLKAIREQLGSEVKLAVDSNGAWSAKSAIRALTKMDRFELEYAEQPVAPWNRPGMEKVAKRLDLPIMADEAIHDSKDAFDLASRRAADQFHLKLMKSGGICEMLRIIAIAEAAGIGYTQGQMNEGRLATAAAVHVAAATNPNYYKELYGFNKVTDDPASGLEIVDGTIKIPDGVGVGISLDERKLKHLATVQ
jgi:L-alanine-DL-glutamate epimerase-like enolase superfamily enzyme